VLSRRFELVAVHAEGADQKHSEVVLGRCGIVFALLRRGGLRVEGFHEERHAKLDGGFHLPSMEAARVGSFMRSYT